MHRDLYCTSSSPHFKFNLTIFDLILCACCHMDPSCCFWFSMLCLVVPTVHLRISLINADWQMTMKIVLLTRQVCLMTLTMQMDCMSAVLRFDTMIFFFPWVSIIRRLNCDALLFVNASSFADCTLSVSLKSLTAVSCVVHSFVAFRMLRLTQHILMHTLNTDRIDMT